MFLELKSTKIYEKRNKTYILLQCSYTKAYSFPIGLILKNFKNIKLISYGH